MFFSGWFLAALTTCQSNTSTHARITQNMPVLIFEFTWNLRPTACAYTRSPKPSQQNGWLMQQPRNLYKTEALAPFHSPADKFSIGSFVLLNQWEHARTLPILGILHHTIIDAISRPRGFNNFSTVVGQGCKPVTNPGFGCKIISSDWKNTGKRIPPR